VADTSKKGPRSMHRARRGVVSLTEVARYLRGAGAVAARWVSSGDDASLWPTVTRPSSWGLEREREHDELWPFWLGEGEQRSPPKRWGGDGFSGISSEGRWNPTLGSGHLATHERGGGVGGFGWPDSRAEEEICERGHATAFAPKQRGK
jgi:hypothetical protein